MKVLITGATGFVGQHLCPTLAAEAIDVLAVSRSKPVYSDSKITHFSMSLDDCTDWSSHLTNIDVVIHLAGRAHVMKESAEDAYQAYMSINVDVTKHLATEAARNGVKRFIYLSSVKVNGERTDTQPYLEADVANPKDLYGKSKLEAEQVLISLCENVDMEFVVIRPPLVYGPKVKANFLSLIKLCQKSIPLPLGAINNKRSFVYIENLVAFIELCLTHPQAANQTFLISDDDDQSTTNLIKTIKYAFGKNPMLLPMPKKVLMLLFSLIRKRALADRLLGNLQVDTSKAKNLLGWKPPFTFAEGIAQTIAYYNKNR